MKIQFIGAARTVTGSQHLLTINNKKILLECGLFQGRRKDTYEKNKNFSFDPKEIDTLILSHAHIDHSGNIPHLVKDGFRGPIYSTSATKDLCEIMLKDSAYLQQRDIEWLNKKNKKHIPDESLYSIEDVDAAIQYFVPVNYNTATEIFPGVTAYFQDAGHILGSAGIFLEIEEENGKKINFGFSGDIGRYDTPIIKDPDYFRDLDLLIMESTYGNRLHTKKDEVEEEVAKVVRQVFD
ncbi:MAG: MBL fold metallo-hydrolase, partial [Ignavibacteriaceae bacterium]|nr:MBL fold metallo-hydrolase [Ignavibacteriaceae bacterium]